MLRPLATSVCRLHCFKPLTSRETKSYPVDLCPKVSPGFSGLAALQACELAAEMQTVAVSVLPPRGLETFSDLAAELQTVPTVSFLLESSCMIPYQTISWFFVSLVLRVAAGSS